MELGEFFVAPVIRDNDVELVDLVSQVKVSWESKTNQLQDVLTCSVKITPVNYEPVCCVEDKFDVDGSAVKGSIMVSKFIGGPFYQLWALLEVMFDVIGYRRGVLQDKRVSTILEAAALKWLLGQGNFYSNFSLCGKCLRFPIFDLFN